MGFEEFKYIVDNNDPTINYIRDKERFFGFEKCNPTSFSREIKELAIEIFSDKELYNDFEFSKENFDINYVNSSKSIWKELGIGLPPIHMYKSSFDPETAMEDGHVTLSFLKSIILGYPTDLPITITDGSLNVSARATYLDYFDKNGIVFQDVVLPKVEKKSCSVIYAHELTHVAMDEARGGCEFFTNRETLPILIELLFADSMKDQALMDKIIKRRLSYLASVIADIHDNKDMPFSKRIVLESYVMSIIQSLTIFNIVKDDDNSIKDIIEDINKVFKEEILTEHMLEKYDADYRNTDLKVKTLKRHMSR